jgi:hypothetical protein
MAHRTNQKCILSLLLILALLATVLAGVYFGYQRGFRHGQTITNKWWIDQQSRYYDAAEVAKQRRALHLDTF